MGYNHDSHDVVVIGRKREMKIAAVLDTGFDGELCLPVELAITLGLDLVSQDRVELADGTTKDELVFEGEVRFLGRRRRAWIFLTSSEDALIGTGLLQDQEARINFKTGSVKFRKLEKGV